MPRVLIASRDLVNGNLMKQLLWANGYEVCGVARTVEDAVDLGLLHKPDIAVVDVRLADGERGSEVVDRLTDNGIMGVLYITQDRAAVMFTGTGSAGTLVSPFTPGELLQSLGYVADIVAADVPAPALVDIPVSGEIDLSPECAGEPLPA